VATDATVGGASSNSYVTLEEANTYLAGRLHADTWTSASDSDKEKALLTACRHVEQLRYWDGNRPAFTDPRQRLTFPRVQDIDADGAFIIPQSVKEAQCEEALALLARGAEQESRRALQASGVRSFAVDGLSESYESGADRQALLSAEARSLLAGYVSKAGVIATSDAVTGEWSPGSRP
jgi:hypothetical protein